MATDGTDWLGLKGKVCAVTGAGGGIGRAVAHALHEVGGAVALLERDPVTLAETEAQLRAAGARVVAAICDVADEGSVGAAATKAAEALGPCDVLVNNAGLLRPGPLESLSLAEWNQVLSINLTGYLLVSQAFGRQMLAGKGGAMVHIASIASRFPQHFSGAYSASKAGVVMLSRQIAVEWGPRGVRSNTVSPGLVRTPLSEAFYQVPGVAERRAAMVPVGRVATPQDIADVVVLLASERGRYVTGEDLCVDGGFGRTLMGLVPRPGYDQPK
jgi:NAD(P)-dependent dehydrogenase (short-subunit alcohol dehydrogenase family)